MLGIAYVPIAAALTFVVIASTVAVFGALTKAEAQETTCSFCNSSVLINLDRANCFNTVYSDRLVRLQRSGRGFVEVNLDGCQGELVSRNKDPNSVLPEASVDDGIVYLDGPSMECLYGILSSTEAPISADQPFRVYFDADCP